jgi:hypothetical protein
VEDGGAGTCGPQALHIHGSGFTGWGGGAEFFLKGTYNTPDTHVVEPVDLGDYVGIRFKAKLGAGHANPVRVHIAIPETTGNDNPDQNGTCDPAVEGDDGCWNHIGRFFWTDEDNPGLSMPMSSEWETYTLCFDTDLYPKWLPSNLSAEERRNLKANFLKVQIDFNKSLNVGANEIDTSEAILHAIGDPFDFWIDDFEFITDESLCNNYPLSGNWTPLNTPGGSCAMAPEAARFNGHIEALYNHWKTEFLSGGRVMMPEQPEDGSTSESQGYGMLLSAAMDDRATFDAVWAETQGHLTGGGVVSWSWNRNDGTSATDGDEDVAYALVLAAKKGWGTDSAADSLAAAIMANDVTDGRIKLGSNFDVAFNPSYFAPYFYRQFSGSWGGVISSGYGIVSSCQVASGLIADWCTFDGSPTSANAVGAEVCGDGMCGDTVFAYEAARAGLRMGVDACWGGTTDPNTILNNLVSFFAGIYDNGNRIGYMSAGWLLDSSNPHIASVLNQAAFIGPLGVAAKSTGHAEVLDNAFRSTLDILETPQFNRVYYSTSLGIMTLLEMSGNMPH